jgi:general secretion pathway protein D
MKVNSLPKYVGGALMVLLCATVELHAQFRGGGFGGFGGFRGGGFGTFNRGGANNSSQYNNNGTVGTAQIYVDPNTHNLVIAADAPTLAQIRDVIRSLDVPQKQVLIRSAFIEVEDNNALALGVQGNYNGFSKNFGVITGYITNYSLFTPTTVVANPAGGSTTTYGTPTIEPSGLTPLTTSYSVNNGFGLPQSLPGAAGNGGLYQIMGNDFTGTLQALATAGKAKLLSRPSILARDGQMAEIVVGQSVYLPSSVTLSSVGGTGATVPSINGSYQNVGIQLDVTPFIGEDNLVQMILQPQITSIDTSTPGQVIEGGSLFSSAVYAPNLNKRSANTVVVTPDGQTVVIGGLTSHNNSASSSKVPLLGDIPLIGNLFKFTSHASQKDELLMFITPHIVQMPTQLTALTSRESGQAPMITNSIPEQELNRFLDRVPQNNSRPAKSRDGFFTPQP